MSQNSEVMKERQNDSSIFSNIEKINKVKFCCDSRLNRPRDNRFDEIIHRELSYVGDGFENCHRMDGCGFLGLCNQSMTTEVPDVIKDYSRRPETMTVSASGLIPARKAGVTPVKKYLLITALPTAQLSTSQLEHGEEIHLKVLFDLDDYLDHIFVQSRILTCECTAVGWRVVLINFYKKTMATLGNQSLRVK
ncbi:hypothetical protein G9A89_007891 [Geosiphon pyriformis]|nr:hypothetical protein G9A89_007891 [Geosiphon pyriformis]